MKKLMKLSLVTTVILGASVANASDTKVVDSINEMFANGKVSGEIRLGYIKKDTSVLATKNTAATAIGGQLKYETAAYYGLSLGTAMYTSHAISALTGEIKDNQYNEDLASPEKNYTELAEAYVHYSRDELNIRAGRQLIDTPLADSDDIRMTPNTFEAYLVSYAMDDFTFIGANVKSWQGFDAGYANVTDNKWLDVGTDNKGVWMGAVLYANNLIEAGAWYYNVGNLANAVYIDAVMPFKLNDAVEFGVGAQYLEEKELENNTNVKSGIQGDVIGLMAEVSAYDFGFSLAYNITNTQDTKHIFGGYGGGAFFTNMETMTADNLTAGQGDASSIVIGTSYSIESFKASVAYGDFKADAPLNGTQADVTEIDVGVTYSYNNEEALFTIAYVVGEDKESTAKTEYDDSHIQITASYTF